MLEFFKIWLELKTDRRAVTALEYGLIAAVVIVVALGAFQLLGTNLSKTVNSVASAM